MTEFFTWLTALEPLYYWGLLLIFGFPLIVLLLNEVVHFTDLRDRRLSRPVRTFRNYVLPLSAFVVVLIYLLGVDRNGLAVKLLETVIWILVINAGIALVNRLFFEDAGKDTWRGRIPQLFLDIFRVFLVICGGAIVLAYVWDQNLGGMVTALGLGSFVLGLALQDTLGNLFSGIALVYEKPFSVGDWIEVDGDYGEVIEMNWRAVRIRTREGKLLVYPHLMIGQGKIINYDKLTPYVVLKEEVHFAYSDPPNRVKEALMETCTNVPGILDAPPPEVKTLKYDENGVRYELEFAIADYSAHEEIMDALMTRIWYTAQRYHLTIPFPQLTLHRAEDQPPASERETSLLEASIARLPSYLPITPENSRELLDGSRILFFGKDEIILRQGDPTGSLYVVLEGDVLLYVEDAAGKAVPVNTLHEGDFFGEVALLSSRTSSLAARAQTDIRVLKILPDEVLDMVSRNPRLAFQLDEVMDLRRTTVEKREERRQTSESTEAPGSQAL